MFHAISVEAWNDYSLAPFASDVSSVLRSAWFSGRAWMVTLRRIREAGIKRGTVDLRGSKATWSITKQKQYNWNIVQLVQLIDISKNCNIIASIL